MPLIVEGLLFLLSLGFLANERFRTNKAMVFLAGTIAVLSTVSFLFSFPGLWSEVVKDSQWVADSFTPAPSDQTASTAPPAAISDPPPPPPALNADGSVKEDPPPASSRGEDADPESPRDGTAPKAERVENKERQATMCAFGVSPQRWAKCVPPAPRPDLDPVKTPKTWISAHIIFRAGPGPEYPIVTFCVCNTAKMIGKVRDKNYYLMTVDLSRDASGGRFGPENYYEKYYPRPEAAEVYVSATAFKEG